MTLRRINIYNVLSCLAHSVDHESNWNSDLTRNDIDIQEEGDATHHEDDLPAEKKAEEKGTWIQEAHEDQRWPECAQTQKIKRQKDFNRLAGQVHWAC